MLLKLSRHENQARLLGEYALGMVQGRYPGPSEAVLTRTEAFFRDSMACAVSALAQGANAPTVLLQEAGEYAQSDRTGYVPLMGHPDVRIPPEKAVVAACSAVREWDANGTNFGYAPERRAVAGEFGHNDFYPVVLAGAHQVGWGGRPCLAAMAVLDEIRGRLAEVFALRRYKIDHVLHGAIASSAVYGAILGASPQQIESALGLVVAHYVPFRAIRAGRQLSDSKGASAALAAEMAVLSVHRALRGFVGPADIFRNPQALFCHFEPPPAAAHHASGAARDAGEAGAGDDARGANRPPLARSDAEDQATEEGAESPFDLHLATAGDDFAVMGMHFKLGLYEHQSAGAIHGLIEVLQQQPAVLRDPNGLRRVIVTIYEPAYSIISDPAKRTPDTRQSADHSKYYIVARVLRKAFQSGRASWPELMLLPEDYSEAALQDPQTRAIMSRIEVHHGGPEYDRLYPDGIPTTVEFEHERSGRLSSGLVMYPEGHARCTSGNLQGLLAAKFQALVQPAVRDVEGWREQLSNLPEKSPADILRIYDCDLSNAQGE